ncbi:unnamed protein product [Meganyctiphanes norvegica]|uniref:Uncharacterized protein n=1 Tax=Meganyctiphanes norvegica TaxID=48144 RepID=A0AAV2SWS2_MEGNR
MESLNIWVDRSLFSLPKCGIDWTSYVFFLNRMAISNGSARIFVPVPTFLQGFSWLETIFCWKLYRTHIYMNSPLGLLHNSCGQAFFFVRGGLYNEKIQNFGHFHLYYIA